MKVFVTGASGFIGSAVVNELIGAGYQVLGLARSAEAAEKLKNIGAEAYHGDLFRPEELLPAIAISDAVIHLGFVHDFTRFKEMCELDEKVVETIGQALENTEKPFLVASGIGVVNKNGIITENDPAGNSLTPRLATETAVDKVAAKGVQVSMVRLPPVVHDRGDIHGFIPTLIKIAKEKGAAAFISEGLNQWPATHRLDVAKLFRLILEKGPKAQLRYHAVAESGIVFKHIAETIARQLQVPSISLSQEEVGNHFGWFAHFAQFDKPSSSQITQEILGWQPEYPTLGEDLEGTAYFPLS